ncbi:MAG: ribonuclease Y [Candidatus Omnitrophica bacterium]|nr:ribonuclease Y [Candidatus Omnitrophota bacterium]
METNLIPLLVAIGGLVLGSVLGYYARRSIARRQARTVEAKVDKLISEAKNQARDIIFKAKEKAVKALDELKREEQRRRDEYSRTQRRAEQREESLDQKEGELKKEGEDLKLKVEQVKKVKEEINRLKEEEIEKLEKISKFSRDRAKEELLKLVEIQYQKDLFEQLKKLEEGRKGELEKKAREIMVSAMQRFDASQIAETTTTTVSLPSDEMKGRIIGKEGRNIKALERLTGVDIIVDETPETIIISGFNPVRRQIAKLTLEKLMADGRIQPARIEETVEKAREEINGKIKEAGEAAVYDAGVVGLDPKLIQLLGRLRFRTSFGQNVLMHSLESAHLAGMLAAELGADVAIAKKAALLHDIGKAIDHEVSGTHVEIGKRILEKFGIGEEVIKAMQAHHEEYPYETIESSIVQAAEAVSAARPGARKETLENYLKRLEELEAIATAFDGVEKAYAIQAGREIRVFVTPEKIDDMKAYKIAKDIAKEIEKELKYPGEIKVTVIRETRSIEYAR